MKFWLGGALVFWVVAFAQASSVADALQYKRTLTQADGLSQVTVYDIEEDLNGYIWLATQRGLDRFDGYSFVNFAQTSNANQRLSSNRALDIELNQTTGDLWIGTASGLNLFDAASSQLTEQQVPALDGGNHKRFNALHFDQNTDLWLEADGNLFVRRKQSDAFEQIPLPDTHAQLNIFEIESDKRNIIYLATTNGVYRFNSQTNQWLPTLRSDIVFYSVFVDFDGALWTGSNGQGLYHFVLDQQHSVAAETNVTTEQGLANNIINDIEQTAAGALWVATASGLSIFEDSKTLIPERINPNDSDSKSIIYSLYITNTDKILYGTLNNGFSIVSPNALLFDRVKLPENEIAYSTAFDADEILWVTTPEGLWKVSPELQAISLLGFEEGDINAGATNTIMSIHYSNSNDILWIGTRVGLARLNDSKDGLVTIGFNGIPIYTINSDKQGNLFLGTVTSGIYHYDPIQDDVLSHYKSGRVVGFHVSSETELWVASLEGIIKINPKTQSKTTYSHDPNDPKSLPHNVVTWISAYSENKYFVATQARGLYLMSVDPLSEDVSFEALFFETELSSISIGAVVQDLFGDYWVTTIKGIAKIDASLSSIVFYDKSDGTSPSGYFIGSNSMDATGRIFFAGSDGVTHFLPNEIIRPDAKSPLHITSIEVLNEDAGWRKVNATSYVLDPIKDESLVLDYHDIVITFELAAIELISPYKIEYMYRLLGFNEQWQPLDSKKRSITYTSLDSGEYVLEIKASNRYGQWTEEPIFMNILVSPPWYLSSLAIALWLTLAILAIYLYARWRSRSHYMRTKELAAEVAIKTKDLELVNEQLRLLSNLDPLTKIYNRRGFTYTANKQFKSFQETQKTFSIVLFDIDYFKRINDGFGHDAGDEILVWVTNKIKALLSADDLLGRWGGEEFIALLPGRDLNDAAKMADQIRKAINKKPIDVLGNSINVSISGGVAEMKVGSSIDSCIKKADVLLYQAKQNGRNQICSKLD